MKLEDITIQRMFKKVFFAIAFSSVCTFAVAQTADDSGISAGFFDSSLEKDINFSIFKLPPLAVLFENAKQNPNILQMAKQQEIAQAEVVKQKKHNNTLVFKVQPTDVGAGEIHLKVEINCKEHFSVLPMVRVPFKVESSWFTGECDVLTYELAELTPIRSTEGYLRQKAAQERERIQMSMSPRS